MWVGGGGGSLRLLLVGQWSVGRAAASGFTCRHGWPPTAYGSEKSKYRTLFKFSVYSEDHSTYTEKIMYIL